MFLIRVSPNIYSSSTVQLTGSSGYSKKCAPSIGWSLRAEPHLSVDVGQEAIPSPHDAAELVREPLAVTPSQGSRPWAGASTERSAQTQGRDASLEVRVRRRPTRRPEATIRRRRPLRALDQDRPEPRHSAGS